MTTEPELTQPPRLAPGPEPDAELSVPVFFLSYAHPWDGHPQGPAQDPGRFFMRFFDDLSESVRELVGSPTGADPGFMDHSIPAGNPWNADLVEAVGTSQVCVALLSEPYAISNWCRLEWFGFAQRPVIRRADGQHVRKSAIIPVVWAPHVAARVPAWMHRAQRFALTGVPASVAADYQADGIVGMLRMNSDSYHPVVWRLALAIADFYHTYWAQTRVLSESELHDAFRRGTP